MIQVSQNLWESLITILDKFIKMLRPNILIYSDTGDQSL